MTDSKEPVTNLVELFNYFIKKWTGDSFPHLIDSDENDGERFREAIIEAFQAKDQAKRELEAENNRLREAVHTGIQALTSQQIKREDAIASMANALKRNQ